MTKKSTIPICTLVLTLGVATLGFAADYGSSSEAPAGTSAATAPAATSAQVVTGTVQKVDATNNNVQIKDKLGTVQTLQVNANTQIARAGSIIQLAELKTGDVVTVTVKNDSTM